MDNLNNYASDLTSGDGTNGILIEIFRRLDIDSGFCVEFGAADGIWNSNTSPFWSNGWNALLIEPDVTTFNKLKKNLEDRENVLTINCYVSPYPENENFLRDQGYYCLDKILDTMEISHKCDKNFDLLSIDVDGNDYHIWKNIKNYKSKCVVIEYNQTIPPNIEFVDDIQEYLGIGASIKSLEKLGKEKGYSLVASTGSNLIFVSNDFVSKLGNITSDIRDLYDLKNLTCLVSTQKQDVVYLTKRRPANYYMTFKKAEGRITPGLPDDRKELKPYKELLYPVQMNYEFNDIDSVRIMDGCLLFQVADDDNDGEIYYVVQKIEDTKKMILELNVKNFTNQKQKIKPSPSI